MASEIAVDSFLDLMRQSNLVTDDQMSALAAEFGVGGSGSESSQKLAEELVRREVLTTWQAEMLLQGKHRGFRLGPYRILQPLGQGGMSKVFLAEHEMMRRRCALKILPRKHAQDVELLKCLQLEAVAIARLDHPNIVRAYDFNKDEKHGKAIHYLVMEYVEGPDLRRLVDDKGPLDYRQAADFIAQAAGGLEHAHAAGFVHRDIKPANLLVDPQGVLKVLDLGLATPIVSDQDLASTEGGQSTVGTADFVAPEQIMDSRSVDGRADIYSLGLTFYFLLTGRRPFPKSTIMELLVAHRQYKPEPISALRPEVPLDLEAIIDKMTAKLPAQRYQTAKEVAEKLRKWLADSGSGRSYSRIAALMAGARRAKNAPAPDAAPDTVADDDIGLAPLDDAPTQAVQPASVPTPAERPATRTAEKSRTAAAKKGSEPKAGAKSASGRKPAARDTAPADLLAGLLDENFAPPAGMELAAAGGVQPLQRMTPSRSKKGSEEQWLKQPWVWLGLGGLALAALVVVLFVGFRSRPADRPSQRLAHEAPGPAAPPVPMPEYAPPEPLEPAVPEEALEPEPAPAAIEDTAPVPVAPAEPAGGPPPPMVPPALPEPELPKPKPEPPPVALPEADEPASLPEQPPAPAADDPAQATPAAEEAFAPEPLLARLEQVSLRVQVAGAQADLPLTQVLLLHATRVAGRLNISVVDDAPNVLRVQLESHITGDTVVLTASAELICVAPDGTAVTAWANRDDLYSGPMRMTRPALTAVRANVASFFEPLPKAIRDARRKFDDGTP